MAAVVQVTVYQIGMVEQVLFAGSRAGSDLRNIRGVVRAASAFAALGVPPFRIRHDVWSSYALMQLRYRV